MQFFTRIITQMLQGPLGEKLANAQWMQNLARNTHKAMEQGGKMAAEQKVQWDATRKAMSANKQALKSDINNSAFSQYIKGIKDEASEFKKMLTEESKTNKKS